MRIHFVVLLTFALPSFLTPSFADLKSIEDGTLVEDFEGSLGDWDLADASAVDIGEAEGGHYLKLGGVGLKGEMSLKERTFKNFTMEVKVRKLYNPGTVTMGINFRNKCSAYFHARGRVELQCSGQQKHTRELKRVRDLERWTTLKLICAGKVVTVYVDGDFACQLTDVEESAGKIGVFARDRVYFDDVRISEKTEPENYLSYEVVSESNALLFDPGKAFELKIRIKNYHADPQNVPLRLIARDWTKRALAESPAALVTIPGGGEIERSFAISALDEGYYQGLIEPSKIIFPLAVHKKPTEAEAIRPGTWPGRKGGELLFGVYWYFKHWDLPEVWKNTYCHAAARDLRRHHFNAVVNMIGMPADQIEILSSYGIACHSRNGRLMEHPLLAGTLVSDEPHPDQIPELKKLYSEIREKSDKSDKVITTCMIGDGGLGNAMKAWDELLPAGGIRLFRWYGIKKEHFGVLHPYGDYPPFVEVLREARNAYLKDGHPYWVILPSLGDRGPDSYYGMPAPSQVSSMMHLSAAYLARGFIFWTYQDHTIDSKGLVNSVSLLPNDQRWETAGKVAAQLSANNALMSSLQRRTPAVWCDNSLVELHQYTDEGQANQYLYVINKHPTEPSRFKLFRFEPDSDVVDLYSSKQFKTKADTVELNNGSKLETGSLLLTLSPGEGMLMQYRQKVTSSKPVTFPEWVETASEKSVQYLFDLNPTNTPSPGWVRAALMQKMKKSIGEMWKWHSGDHKLFSASSDLGIVYPKSLYAQAECRIDYDVPDGFTHFVAAAGFGTTSPEGDVIFRVYADGSKKYDSGIKRVGDPVIALVVDITGAKKLSLVTDCADFSIKQDYAFWGSARLVKKE